MQKLSLTDLLRITGPKEKAIARANTIEWLTRACASGVCHGDVSTIVDTIPLLSKRTRMGLAVSQVLSQLVIDLKIAHMGRLGNLPKLPEEAVEVTGKQREKLVMQWCSVVANASIVAAELAAKTAAEIAKAAKATRSQ